MKISIIGMGYVGLPLANEFAKLYQVVGFDINTSLINNLSNGIDITKEIINKNFHKNNNLKFTYNSSDLDKSDYFVITVPTPVDKHNTPDLSNVINATKMIAHFMKKGSIVIYESTFYPGCTNKICAPILENLSKMKFNKDFFCAYSPERINPGDKKNTLTNTVKLVSGSTANALKKTNNLYRSIGIDTFKCDSMEIAESAKVIENVQRDINIALVNELAIIFKRLNIDINKILEAAKTKWNFLDFKPGLVGGHCIGVDPYYLTHRAQSVSYSPQVILAGRRINDNMGRYVAREAIRKILLNNLKPKDTKIIILGITFKEDCPDLRNSKVLDIYHELISFGYNPKIYDPYVKKYPDNQVNKNLILNFENIKNYNVAIFAVAHKEFKRLTSIQILKMLVGKNSIIYDVKSIFYKKRLKDCLYFTL